MAKFLKLSVKITEKLPLKTSAFASNNLTSIICKRQLFVIFAVCSGTETAQAVALPLSGFGAEDWL
jgi:hypothetical protein